MHFTVLGSGSSGNSTLIRSGDSHILLDAGLSARQLLQRCQLMGTEKIDAILLTHEHGDHVRGLVNFLKKHPIPVYTTSQTAYVLRQSGIQATWHTFEAGQSFRIHDFEVASFPILHDAVDPVGYVVSTPAARLGILSDAGHVTHGITENLRHAHSLFIEANYDEDLLAADTKRPWSIKQRISSRHGHLSNTQAAALVTAIAHPTLKRIVLGHLSGDCNSAPLAESIIRHALTACALPHVDVTCACQSEPRGWWPVA